MKLRLLMFLVIIEVTGCAPRAEFSSSPESREARQPSTAAVRKVVQEKAERPSASEAAPEASTTGVIAASANGKLSLTVLPPEVQERLSECACTFSPGGDRDNSTFLTGWLDPADGAWMQINGSTENLTIDRERNQRANGKHGRPEVGDKTTYSLSNAKYKSDVECNISDTCWESGECESIGYECEVTVRSMDATVTVPVTGICGC